MKYDFGATRKSFFKMLRVRSSSHWIFISMVCISIQGCRGRVDSASEKALQVRTQVVKVAPHTKTGSLTGEFRARYQSDLAFRMGGRIATRNVDVGDRVSVGDVLATLDTQERKADIAAANATLRSAEASLQQASATVERIERLVATQAASQEEYDDAKAAFLTAQGMVDISKAAILTAEEMLAYTEIKADTPGVIIARTAEVGQVVNAAQTVFTLAYDGEREAVFDVFQTHVAEKPVDDEVDITLVSNPAISTTGRVREIAPSIDQNSGTVRVKVSINSPPPQMTLGAPVIGVASFQSKDLVKLPWTALARKGEDATVWVVDPVTSTVSERVVQVDSHASGMILISSGLETGDIVVTDGVPLVLPGQKVASIEGSNP